jgi:hypothetical protein
MMNRVKNVVIFWAIALFVGWVVGRFILRYLSELLLPTPIVWGDPTLLASRAIWPYLAARRALVGTLVLSITSLIWGFFMDKDTSGESSDSDAIKRRLLGSIIAGLRIALAGYMFIFGMQLVSYWQILFAPDTITERLPDLGAYLAGVLSILVIVTVIGYTVVFEPWSVILQSWKGINHQNDKSKLFLLYRTGSYVILNLLLLWFAYPNSGVRYYAIVVFAAIGVFWIRLHIQKRGRRDPVTPSAMERM